MIANGHKTYSLVWDQHVALKKISEPVVSVMNHLKMRIDSYPHLISNPIAIIIKARN